MYWLTMLFLFTIFPIDIFAQYDYKEKVKNTNLTYVRIRDKWGALDNDGHVVIPIKYHYDKYIEGEDNDYTNHISAWSENQALLIQVECNGRYGMINIQGEEVIPVVYENIWEDVFDPNNPDYMYICVKKGGKYGFVDSRNNTIIGFSYDDASGFNHDLSGLYLARVCKNGLWGVINQAGNLIVPMQYTKMGFYSEGVLFVEKNGKVGGIDHNGQTVVSFFYDAPTSRVASLPRFRQGRAALIKYNKCGLIDHDENQIVPFEYDAGRRSPHVEICGSWTAEKGGRKYFFDRYGKQYATSNDRNKALDTMVSMYVIHASTYGWNSGKSKYPLVVHAESGSSFKDVTVLVNGRERKIDKTISYKNIYINSYINLDYGDNTIDIVYSLYNGTRKTFRWKVFCDSEQPDKKPIIEWLSLQQQTSSPNNTFELGIKSDHQLTSVICYVNGSQTRSLGAVADDGYDFRRKYRVSLKEGENVIRVEATNSYGTAVKEKTITYYKSQTTSTQERRIALVVGNNTYGDGNDLRNSINDARAIASKLETLGFTVMTAYDQTRQQLETTLSSFCRKATSYNVALFYYAGHGMALNNRNYIIPIGTNMSNETVARYNSIDVQMVLDLMNSSGCSMKMLILDACRDNPFAKRGGMSGFGAMDAAEGTIIFFSTAVNTQASDGSIQSGHSPFATAFLNALEKPNLSEDAFLKEVTTSVKKATGGAQLPYRTSAFTGSFFFNKR